VSRTQLPKETAFLLGAGAGLITYLAFGITIWQVRPGYTGQIVYILSVAVAGLSYRIIRLSKRNAELGKQLAKLELSTSGESLAIEEMANIDGLAKGLLGLMVHLTQPPHSDTQHHLTYVREEYVVHGDDGTFNWIVEGYNALDTPSPTLFVKISGDSPLDVTELPLTVLDRLRGDAPLRTACVGDRPNCKAYAVEFQNPLEPRQNFSIQVNCRWKNTFIRTRRRDYVFFSWGEFASLGIDRLTGRLVCDIPIVDFVLERFDDGQRLREPRQPQVMDSSAKHTVLEWEVLNPRSIYVLSFTKLLGTQQ
jgi:hypothetical protein